MKKITFPVTQEDIDNGQKLSPSNCPIALAFRKTEYYANIGTDSFGIQSHYLRIGGLFYEHSDDVVEFIRQFDYNNKFTAKPFIYEGILGNDE